MTAYEDIFCTQSVDRKIPGHVRVIQWMLYTAVLIFTIMGAMQGFVWLLPALGTLFGSWYYMGAARVTYDYKLEGARFTVTRISGLQSKRKSVPFGNFDLTTLRSSNRRRRTVWPPVRSASSTTCPRTTRTASVPSCTSPALARRRAGR